MKRNGPLIHCW